MGALQGFVYTDRRNKISVKSWIIDWFLENSNVEKDEIIAKPSENYLINGWIDSFKFINFISDIEENFDIIFSNDEFQDRNFGTIDGLISAIKKKISENE